MGFSVLLFLPFYFVLLLPVLSFLLCLVRLACQVILSIFWKQARTHFTLWPPDSSFLLHLDPGASVHAAKLGVCRYEVGGGERTECVFCLCEVEEGEEIRELGCRHLFHRGCLDRWLEHGRATCPLCRGPLLPPGSKPDHADGSEEEPLPEDFTLPFAVLVRSCLLVW
uniref:Putative E3 ubiquitin-protein ligase RHA2B n=1 Tax=Anthurium amnicola TaxID=1678845 RepID=A0A1D1YXJ1_9ARAE